MNTTDLTACNGVAVSELNAFREKFYPDVKVKIIVDPSIVAKGLVGMADPDGHIRLAPGILGLDDSKKFYSGIKLTFRAMCYLTTLHELAHFVLGHTPIWTESEKKLVYSEVEKIQRGAKNVNEIVRELPKEIQAKSEHLSELQEGCASLWAFNEYVRLVREGVIHE